MSKCNFCDKDVKEWDSKRAGYLVASLNQNGDEKYHTHVHGTLDDKNIAEDLIDAQILQTGLVDLFKQKYSDKSNSLSGIKEIIFHNRQRIGDMFMFTCAVRDFKAAYPEIKVNVLSTCGHIWDNNPAIERTVQPFYKDGVTLENAKPADFLSGKTNVLKIGPSKLTNSSNRIDWHFANAFRVSIEENLGIKIPQGESRGEVWFTQEEYDAPRIDKRPYWIIVTGGEKGWGCKMYPTVRWQEVIDQNPDIIFYQLGARGDNHARLQGNNVVDWIGRTEDRETGIRDLMKLFLNAEGSMGLVSFHMHLSGALKKPCVVVAGAREPVSFTRYAGHQYIATDGTLPCATSACWHCDIKACTNPVTVNGEIIPKCVDMITSEEVSRYLNRYYVGGLLDKKKPSAKPKLRNIVPTPAKLVTAIPVEKPKSIYNTYGLEFNGGALTERDWEFICQTIEQYKVKSVLEFGAGLSTLLLNDKVKDVVTYECAKGWIDKLEKLKPGMLIKMWDGKSDIPIRKADMAFVDGPAGDIGREVSTKLGAKLADVVIVHDAGREWARKYQEQYLVPGFEGPIRGGHRCHLWIRKGLQKNNAMSDNVVPITKCNVDTKTIKIVSTARGWGGCARSITTMMKLLLSEGHKVEFIPFRNIVSSNEFQQCIKKELAGLKVTSSYDTIAEHCDVLLMYADDYIWEFNRPELAETFSAINADKKIMVLNYRRGPVGQAEWTKGWDKYVFLNKAQESDLLKVHPGVKTRVLPPCTDLAPFLAMKPNFEKMVRIVRHNSQGDTKFPKNCGDEIEAVVACRQDISISMMPGPSYIPDSARFNKVTRNNVPIPQFLASGNLFWYSLPEGYMDMGPRVILEAMATGLPVIADNWGGAVDRVTPDTGWLCNTKEQMVEIISGVQLGQLEHMGNAAKDRAREHFHMDNWIKEIIS